MEKTVGTVIVTALIMVFIMFAVSSWGEISSKSGSMKVLSNHSHVQVISDTLIYSSTGELSTEELNALTVLSDEYSINVINSDYE